MNSIDLFAVWGYVEDSMSDTTFIYSLSDPTTGKIRYVGKTDDLPRRLTAHCSSSHLHDATHKTRWILTLLAEGLKPRIGILAEVPTSQWEFWEREYIRVLKASGANLVNATEGGEGQSRGFKHSEKTRKKMGIVRKGRPRPAFSEEWRKNIGAASKGRPTSAAQKAAAKLANTGRCVSEETREKLRRINLGKKHSSETRAKISAVQKGRIVSAGARKNLSVAQRRRWATIGRRKRGVL
jgi:group I intron endonuclease